MSDQRPDPLTDPAQALPEALTGREPTLETTPATLLSGRERTLTDTPAALLTGRELTLQDTARRVLGSEPTLTDTPAPALSGRELTLQDSASDQLGSEPTLKDTPLTIIGGGPTTPPTFIRPPTLGAGRPKTGHGTSSGFDDAWHLQGRKGPFTGQTWGDFALGGILGEGGMGAVYRAKQISLYRRVALKVLPPNLAADARLLERFLLEARTASTLQSPHVVQVYAIGEHEGNHYFAMEFVDGTDLYEVIRARREAGTPITPDEAADYILQAARGLAEAGRHGIVHRDIKPPNLMVTRKDNLVKIADFGIVKILGEHQLTMTGQAIGTPAYVSPEQGRGDREIDQRSDLYSLGVVFYELLCGTKPFEGTTPSALIYQHCYDEPKLPQQVDPRISNEYQAVVLRLLQKKPENRYQTADELATDLQAIKTGEMLKHALANFKGTGADEARREQMNWFQRNLLKVSLAAGIVVLGGGSAAYWYLDQQNQHRTHISEEMQSLSPLDQVASLPPEAEARIAAFGNIVGTSDPRVVRWQAKVTRVRAYEERLRPLDTAVTGALRASAPADLGALAKEVGTADANVVRWSTALANAAQRDDALRSKLGIIDTQALTATTRDQLHPLLIQLSELAASDDRQVAEWTKRIAAFDARVAALLVQLAPLDQTATTITESRRIAAIDALGQIRPLLGESDPRVQRWSGQLAAAGSVVERLRKALGDGFGRVDVPSLTLRDRLDIDLAQFTALVEANDPDVKRWHAQLTAADAAMARYRERLGVIDTVAADDLLPIPQLAPLGDDLAALRNLARPGDADVLRWQARLDQMNQNVVALRASVALLDATQTAPLSLAQQTALGAAVARLDAKGGLEAKQRAMAQQRLADEATRIATARERLHILDQSAPIQAGLRQDLARLAIDVGATDPDVSRWQKKVAEVDDLLLKLAALGDEKAPVPSDCRTLFPQLIALVGNQDPAVVQWSGRMGQVAELDTALAPLDHRAPLPLNVSDNLKRSALLFGAQDPLHVRRAAKVARVAALKQQLQRLEALVVEPASQLSRDRAALDEIHALVGSTDRDLPRFAQRLIEHIGPERPLWASNDGRDEFGRWAEAKIAGQLVRFRYCPNGRVQLGSPASEAGRDDDEVQTTIILSRGWWLADSECTQGLWQAVMNSNPSRFSGAQRPVERVASADINQFFTAVNRLLPTCRPRLPTEAEWEYACRAGRATAWSNGNNPSEALGVAWCADNAEAATHEIRQRFPNALGLFDMQGNVWEWCTGLYTPYPTAQTSDWLGREGQQGVVRGGSWGDPVLATRAANRQAARPDLRSAYVGLRLAVDAQWQKAPDGATLLATQSPNRQRIEVPLGSGKIAFEVEWPPAQSAPGARR